MAENFQELGIPGSLFEMHFIEGGEFDMGDHSGQGFDIERPVHRVRLNSFFLGMYPVPQRLWKVVMGTNPSYFKGQDRPIESVSWNDCQEFLKKLNVKTGKAYRLPTEAEWEFAARGGTKNQGFSYAGNDKLKEVGWYKHNSHGETKFLGQKRPNELGLYDMCGNVWEWCQDGYDGTYYKNCADRGLSVNPRGPRWDRQIVLRGGAWDCTPWDCRVAYRYNWSSGYRSNSIGFRLAISLQVVGL